MGQNVACKKLDGSVGKHCIAELCEGCPSLLNNEDFIKQALKEAAEAAGATLLSVCAHSFSPQGVTAIALLSESHIAIHTWPETQYAAVDAFTCGHNCDPEKACRYLEKAFKCRASSKTLLRRTVPQHLVALA